MATIQDRFEVERPVGVVYEALSQPDDLLRALPGLARVTRVSDDVYRIGISRGDAMREVELMVSGRIPAQRVEWRLANDTWSAAFDLESVGPARTAVAVAAQGMPSLEGETPTEALLQQGLDVFKTALRAPHVRIHAANPRGLYDYAGIARRYASEWRAARLDSSLFARPIEYPFRLMQGFSKQMDRLWDQVWRGTPVGRLPQMMPGLPGLSGIPGISWSPSVEVCEKEDQVRVCIDVPGRGRVESAGADRAGRAHDPRRTARRTRPTKPATVAPRSITAPLRGAFRCRRASTPMPRRPCCVTACLEIRIPLHRREPRRVPVQHVSG